MNHRALVVSLRINPKVRIRVFAAQSFSTNAVSDNNSTCLSASRKRWYERSKTGGSTSFVERVMRLVCSGVVVVGSSLGLAYCSSSIIYDRDSIVSYADSGTNEQEPEPKSEPDNNKNKKSGFLFNESFRRKVFFKYEKRIRTGSPPEKVFEYFASYQAPSGEVYMTPADLMRAVVPVFPPSDADFVRTGSLKGEAISSELRCDPSEFFMLFDTDNDGLISFPEYIFFVTILGIPEASFTVAFKMFDLDGNGVIDKDEFRKVMALMRTRTRQGASHRDGKRVGFKSTGSVENGGLLEHFFGKDGNKSLELGKFDQFLRDLHEEMLQLEFKHYDFKSQGTISAKDFALSMVASADMRCINRFLDRVDEIDTEPSLQEVRITYDEFKSFAELRRRLEPFSMALFSYGQVNGLLSKQDFKRAADQVCGVPLSKNVVDMVFYIFDANRDGDLSADEFLRVLERREGDSHSREAGFSGLISCWVDCTRSRKSH